MTTISFVNTGSYTYNVEKKRFADPVHLVAMHNICGQAGHLSDIFQLGYPDPETSIQTIYNFRPTVLALSFIEICDDDLDLTQKLLQQFKNKGFSLFIGGSDVDLQLDLYLSIFEPKSPEEWRCVFLVQGYGEPFISAIAHYNLDPEHPQAQKNLQNLGIVLHKKNSVSIVRSLLPLSLNSQIYTRDYDIEPFAKKFAVKWATGCWGTCRFCYNFSRQLDYKQPSLAAAETAHLIVLGAKYIDIASPQFTAHPDHASAILAALPPNTPSLSFTTRVDSLYYALQKHPDIWKNATNIIHQIDLGIESFIPERLVKMGKYRNLKQAQTQDVRLINILNFFLHTQVIFNLYIISLDWQMNLFEAEKEARGILFYLNRYPRTIRILPDQIGDILVFSKGSSYSQGRTTIDFLCFQKDPRLLLLHYTAKLIAERMFYAAQFLSEPHALLMETIARALAKSYLRFIQLLQTFSHDIIDLNLALPILKRFFSIQEVWQNLVDLMPNTTKRKINKWIKQETAHLERTLMREMDELLKQKVLSS